MVVGSKHRHLHKCAPSVRGVVTARTPGKHRRVAVCMAAPLPVVAVEGSPPENVCDTCVMGSGAVKAQETFLLQGEIPFSLSFLKFTLGNFRERERALGEGAER